VVVVMPRIAKVTTVRKVVRGADVKLQVRRYLESLLDQLEDMGLAPTSTLSPVVDQRSTFTVLVRELPVYRVLVDLAEKKVDGTWDETNIATLGLWDLLAEVRRCRAAEGTNRS
jgi:hypothetical protein